MRIRLLIFISIFIPIYILYLLTMPPTVFWQDSGIILAGIHEFGVLFPPGFPVYLLLAVLWTKLISLFPVSLAKPDPALQDSFQFLINFSFAQQVHAFSGLWGAAASALIGLSVFELIHQPSNNHRTTIEQPLYNYLVPLISGLSAGFSYSLWAQSTNAEVYSLMAFLSSLLFYLVIRFMKRGQEKKNYPKYLILIAFVWGLSFGVHLLTLVFILPFLFLSFSLRFFPLIKIKVPKTQTYRPLVNLKTWLVMLAVFFLAAFTPYLYLPLRSAADPGVLWKKIDSPQAFVGHLTGRDYRTSEGAIQLASLEKLRSYPILFFQEFFVIGILLGTLGLFFLVKRKHPFVFFGLLFGLTLYLLISFYERGTEYNYWLLPFYLFFWVMIGIGLQAIIERVRSVLAQLLILLILFILLLSPLIFVNWPILNRSHYVLAKEFGQNLIGKLPKGAIFFTLGDQESSIPGYLLSVESYRPDLSVLTDATLVSRWSLERLTKRRPDLKITIPKKEDSLSPEEYTLLLNQFVEDNLDKGIFVITKTYLPLAPQFKLIPAGTIWQIRRPEDSEEINLAYWDYQFSDPKRYQRPERPELVKKGSNKRVPYYHEAQVFELQAKKNLGDWCFNALEENRSIRVETLDGKDETWKGERLRECALEAYKSMSTIDPKFEHREIFSRIQELEAL